MDKEEQKGFFLNLFYSFPRWNWNNKECFVTPEDGFLTPRAWRIYNILDTLDLSRPITRRSFLRNVHHMHKYQFALDFLNTFHYPSESYAQEMVKQNRCTSEIEEVLIRKDCANLLYDLNKAGHKWSPSAKELIKKLHPKTYNHFFGK